MSKSLNKSELVAAIAKQANVTKADAERSVNSYIAVVTGALKQGKKVSIPGFCTIERSRRAARTGRNPQTGQAIKIAARNVARFKPGKTLNDQLN